MPITVGVPEKTKVELASLQTNLDDLRGHRDDILNLANLLMNADRTNPATLNQIFNGLKSAIENGVANPVQVAFERQLLRYGGLSVSAIEDIALDEDKEKYIQAAQRFATFYSAMLAIDNAFTQDQ